MASFGPLSLNTCFHNIFPVVYSGLFFISSFSCSAWNITVKKWRKLSKLPVLVLPFFSNLILPLLGYWLWSDLSGLFACLSLHKRSDPVLERVSLTIPSGPCSAQFDLDCSFRKGDDSLPWDDLEQVLGYCPFLCFWCLLSGNWTQVWLSGKLHGRIFGKYSFLCRNVNLCIAEREEQMLCWKVECLSAPEILTQIWVCVYFNFLSLFH